MLVWKYVWLFLLKNGHDNKFIYKWISIMICWITYTFQDKFHIYVNKNGLIWTKVAQMNRTAPKGLKCTKWTKMEWSGLCWTEVDWIDWSGSKWNKVGRIGLKWTQLVEVDRMDGIDWSGRNRLKWTEWIDHKINQNRPNWSKWTKMDQIDQRKDQTHLFPQVWLHLYIWFTFLNFTSSIYMIYLPTFHIANSLGHQQG